MNQRLAALALGATLVLGLFTSTSVAGPQNSVSMVAEQAKEQVTSALHYEASEASPDVAEDWVLPEAEEVESDVRDSSPAPEEATTELDRFHPHPPFGPHPPHGPPHGPHPPFGPHPPHGPPHGPHPPFGPHPPHGPPHGPHPPHGPPHEPHPVEVPLFHREEPKGVPRKAFPGAGNSAMPSRFDSALDSFLMNLEMIEADMWAEMSSLMPSGDKEETETRALPVAEEDKPTVEAAESPMDSFMNSLESIEEEMEAEMYSLFSSGNEQEQEHEDSSPLSEEPVQPIRVTLSG